MSSEATPTERRVVTVLFVDVVGSTRLAESMDPEDWTEVVNRAVAVMSGSVDRYSGTIAQFAGDSILALFGAPTAHEDDPYRAVRAALDILASVETLSAEVEREMGIQIQVRAGINTGLVVTGDLAAGDLNVYAALGDTSNVAARMQGLAEPGTLVISEATYRLVSTDVDVDALGPTELKGKSEPMPVYRVTDVRGVDSRARGIPGLSSTMVGRDRELDTLTSLVGAANAGRCSVAAVVGEPGVGKSRLLAELRERVAGENGSRWALGRCASYDEQRPYHLIASLLRSVAGVTDSDDLDTVGAALATAAAPVLGSDDPRLGHLLQLLGVTTGHGDDRPDVLQQAYTAALADLICGLAERHRPLVLALEDVHWSDASSAELLMEALQRLRQAAVLVVFLTRPDRGSHGWEILEGARRSLGEALVEIDLKPLDPGDSRLLVGNLLEIESLPQRLRDTVLERAEGNPFFLEEMVRMLIDRELIERVGDRWTARAEIARLDVPETLQGLLAARIDMLPGPARAAGKVASVIGRQFEARLLDDILPVTHGNGGSDPGAQLSELESSGFVRLAATRPQLEFAFRHVLIRDVIYDSILKRERLRLHRSVAQAIESNNQGRLDELAPVLARHYAEAGVADRAVRYLMTAGEQSLARHARQEAYEFFSQASAQLEAMEDAPARLVVEAAIGRARAGQNFVPGPEALEMLAGALDAAERVGAPDLSARLALARITTWEMMGELQRPEARAATEQLFALLPELDDPGLRGNLKALMGHERRAADDFPGAQRFFAESVSELESADRPSEASVNAAYLADSHSIVGDFDAAATWIEHASALARESGDPNAIADADLIRGKIASDRGDLEEALDHTRRGTTGAEDAGNVFCTLAGNFFAGDQELRRGRTEAAIEHLEKTSELAAFCNAGAFTMLGAAWLATARARLGDLDAADFDTPLAQAQAAGSRMGEGLVRLQRAIALSGDETSLAASLDDFARAEELFGQIGARPLQARALHAHGQALEVAGDHAAAQERFAEASSLFGQLGIAPDPVG
jgi:class 3 adenylate cyclase/tetratricopeptide (TPR) repeat protein